ncbi:MAG: hypothetical protein ACO213_11075 [Steroidobacteraceae bacterium]
MSRSPMPVGRLDLHRRGMGGSEGDRGLGRLARGVGGQQQDGRNGT